MPITSRAYRKPDVENFRDFYQYYRGGGRWLGYMEESGFVSPINFLNSSNNGSELFVVKINQDGSSNEILSSWKAVMVNGVFGSPLVGNHPLGKSYLNFKRTAVRDSAKGLVLASIAQRIIDPEGYGKYNFNKTCYGKKDGELASELTIERLISRGASSVISHVYNPVFKGYFEVLESMLAGDIFGAPLNHLLGLHFFHNSTTIKLVYGNIPIGAVSDDIDHPAVKLDKPNEFMIHYLHNVLPQGTVIR